jgi:hypothetical protein
MTPPELNHMDKRYTLEVNETQLKTIMAATELLSRVTGGQWQEMIDWLPLKAPTEWSALHDDVDVMTHLLSQHMKDNIDGRSSAFGVGNPQCHEYHDVAYDIKKTIEHKISWERAVEEGIVESEESPRKYPEMLTVNFDNPMNFSGHPLPKINRV